MDDQKNTVSKVILAVGASVILVGTMLKSTLFSSQSANQNSVEHTQHDTDTPARTLDDVIEFGDPVYEHELSDTSISTETISDSTQKESNNDFDEEEEELSSLLDKKQMIEEELSDFATTTNSKACDSLVEISTLSDQLSALNSTIRLSQGENLSDLSTEEIHVLTNSVALLEINKDLGIIIDEEAGEISVYRVEFDEELNPSIVSIGSTDQTKISQLDESLVTFSSQEAQKILENRNDPDHLRSKNEEQMKSAEYTKDTLGIPSEATCDYIEELDDQLDETNTEIEEKQQNMLEKGYPVKSMVRFVEQHSNDISR